MYRCHHETRRHENQQQIWRMHAHKDARSLLLLFIACSVSLSLFLCGPVSDLLSFSLSLSLSLSPSSFPSSCLLYLSFVLFSVSSSFSRSLNLWHCPSYLSLDISLSLFLSHVFIAAALCLYFSFLTLFRFLSLSLSPISPSLSLSFILLSLSLSLSLSLALSLSLPLYVWHRLTLHRRCARVPYTTIYVHMLWTYT